MRYDGELRFYTTEDVNHGRVRDAMADAGRRTTPYPFAWLGITGHKYLIRGKPTGPRPDEIVLPGHEYGPHRPENEPTYKPVPVRVRWDWRHVEIDADLLHRQRRQINQLAYESRKR